MKKTVLWIARISAAASIVVLLVFILGHILDGGKAPSLNEVVGLAFFPSGVLFGLLLGYKQPMYGGSVAIVSLLAFYSWNLTMSGDLPSGPYFLIFASPGILFLASGWLANRRQAMTL